MGTRRLASSGLPEHPVQMACSVYALQIPRKERHGLQGSQENCSRTVDVSLSQSHLRPPPGPPGRGGGEGGGVWGPRGLYLETTCHLSHSVFCGLRFGMLSSLLTQCVYHSGDSVKESLSLPSGSPVAPRVKSPPALQARLAQAGEPESFSGSSNMTLERHAAAERLGWRVVRRWLYTREVRLKIGSSGLLSAWGSVWERLLFALTFSRVLPSALMDGIAKSRTRLLG